MDTRWALGAGRWLGTQAEVVIEVETVSKEHIRSLGGYSSNYEELEQLGHLNIHARFGRLATAEELAYLRTRVGPTWIDRDATKRVLARTAPHIDMLREVKLLQQEMAKQQGSL